MILARAICADSTAELELAFRRMGLPSTAREYLLEKVPQLQILLTGLERVHGAFLKDQTAAQRSPGREQFPFYVAGDQRQRPGTATLAGRREQFDHLIAAARGEQALSSAAPLRELADALQRTLDAGAVPPPLVIGGRELCLGQRTYLMAVLNVTPDSFSDGGQFLRPEAAIAQGEAMAKAGADLIDVGGESTRPGAPEVSADEELSRVLPVIRGLGERTGVPLSIDTSKAAVAREALAAGAAMVNDISGLHFDPQLSKVVAEAQAACCLMHIQGTPRTMQESPRYQDVISEVIEGLQEGVSRALQAGIARSRLLIDPGIGFGKTLGHNLFLLRRLRDLRVLGLPIVAGTSRKSFLGKLTGDKPVDQRLWASLGSVAAIAVTSGADLVRVHDVAQTRDALAVADAIAQANEGGDLFLAPARS